MLLDEWMPHPRRPERDEALGEWALRYFHSHGPATVKDFAWFQSTVIADGEIIGTWKRTGRGSKQTVLATPFTTFSSMVHDAVPRLYDALP